MATESADGPDVSVSLPPPLEEWLDERADELGVERSEVLVQLLCAYRATTELDDDVEGLVGEELEARLADAFEARIDERVETLESTHSEDVEDLRNRVLQLRDVIREVAAGDHEHDELRDLAERLDALSSDLADVGAEVADLTDRVDGRDDRLADVESKLDRLAGAVLAIRDDTDGRDGGDGTLEHIRVTANRSRVQVARCVDCGRAVRIALLTRPACPHCETEFRDLEVPTSVLGRWLDPRNPTLVGSDPPALESANE